MYLKAHPHPKIHFCSGASDLDGTLRDGVSRYDDLTMKSSARNIEPIKS